MLTDEEKRRIIDYYFQAPNSKSVLEDGDGCIESTTTRADVTAFLLEVYTYLVETYGSADPHGIAEMIDADIVKKVIDKFVTHNEWIKSLGLPPGVGVSTSEAFEAGRDSFEADIKQMWLEAEDKIEFAEEVVRYIGEE